MAVRPEHEERARAEFGKFLKARELSEVPDDQRELLWDAFRWAWRPPPATQLQVIFDGPPSIQGGHFVEVVDAAGLSVKQGVWTERDNGYWALQLGGLAGIEPGPART